MLLEVNVTQDDIDHGCAGQPQRCPVALGIGRLGFAASVSAERIAVWRVSAEPYSVRSVPVPGEVQSFIYWFDAFGRDGVFPIAFRLDVPGLEEEKAA